LSESQVRRVAEQMLDVFTYLHNECGLLHGDIKPENILLATENLDELHAVERMRSSHLPPSRRERSAHRARRDVSLGIYDAIKLCDFGHARSARDARYYDITGSVSLVPFHDLAGTQGYMAPEILGHRPYTAAVDMWALGVVLFESLGGYMPFRPPSKCETTDVSFPSPDWDGISDAAKDFLAGLLARDPRERLTADAARAHPFMRGSDA
jgi:serine/threonine protein kinase